VSDHIFFYVPGDPKPQPRPRAFARKMGDHYVARVYDAGTAEGWKSAIAEAAKAAGLTKFAGAVAIELRFNFKRPKSHFRRNGEVKDSAPFFHSQRPDYDNLEKGLIDALTKLGAWDDDAQIADVHTTKHWAIGNWTGGCSVTIRSLEPARPP
jgi:Holliday junction resolvase